MVMMNILMQDRGKIMENVENKENLNPNEEASMETDYVEAIKNLKQN